MSIPEQALRWFVRAHEEGLTAAGRKELSNWLAESPVHVREYIGAAELYGTLSEPTSWPADPTESLLDTVRREKDSNVRTLKMPGQEIMATVRQSPRPQRWLLATAAALGALTLFGLLWIVSVPPTSTYQTVRGEQRSVVLTDGSIAQLNTMTRMIVRFDKQQRLIELPSGEALFHVTHDKTRPFVVSTPYATVQAVGTEFDVYNRAASTQVAVIEGRVTVESAHPASKTGSLHADGPATAVPLVAGQQIVLMAGNITPPSRGASATAWVERRIALDDDSVATAVDEFNRYNLKQIRIQDESISKLRITGVFNADDPDALIQYLQEVQGVKVVRKEQLIVLER
jgi:transmembrane sensor